MGEGGEIAARPDRSLLGDDRQHVPLDERDEEVEGRLADAAVAARENVGAQDHERPRRLSDLDASSACRRQGDLLEGQGPSVEDDAHAAALLTERPLARKRSPIPIETLPPLRYCAALRCPVPARPSSSRNTVERASATSSASATWPAARSPPRRPETTWWWW